MARDMKLTIAMADGNNRTAETSHKLNRRDTIKHLGASIVAIGSFSGKSVADADNNSTRNLLHVAKDIGNAQGPEARAQFLRNNDLPTSYSRTQFSLEDSETTVEGTATQDSLSGGISPERVDCVDPTSCEGDIDVTLSLTALWEGGYYASVLVRMNYFRWVNRYGTYYKGGESPADGIGIQWERDHWRLENPDNIPESTVGDTNISWDNGSWDHQGLAFKVDDEDLCKDSGYTRGSPDWSDYESCGVYIEQGDEYQMGDDITASYRHTWNGYNLDFSVSYPWGISIAGGSNIESKDFQTELNGDTLRVTRVDADLGRRP